MDGLGGDSFYVTLISSGSKDYYPNNTASSFSTQLPHPISLIYGSWRVALHSIIFPKSWFNIRDNINNGLYIDPGTGLYKSVKIPEGSYESPLHIIQELNNLIEEIHDDVNSNIAFSINKKSNKIEVKITNNARVIFQDKLSELLGFVDVKEITESTVGDYSINVDGDINFILIISDLIESQIIGSSKLKLLKVIPAPRDTIYGSLVSITFENQYLNVEKKYFDSIKIDILSEKSEKIPFLFKDTVLVLHFEKGD